MNEQTKKILWIVFAIALIGTFAVWMTLNPAPQHIEDTNGPSDYSLQQITEENIVSLDIGSRGGPNTSEVQWNVAGFDVSTGVRYYSDKFTGVYRLYAGTVFKGSDIFVYLTDFHVNSGNFAFYVVLDGEIVGEVKPDEFGLVEFRIDNIDKTASLEYIIAGESADFRFTAPIDW